MKTTWSFLSSLLISSVARVILVRAQDQKGFISLDCGLTANSSYREQTIGINYISDERFIQTGVIKEIATQYKTSGLRRQLWNVRSFPEGARNCYTLNPARGKSSKYLIRASFMYGDYDDKGVVPEFDLYLGIHRWDSASFDDLSTVLHREIIYTPTKDYIQVCLVKTGPGTPFISALELRPLENSTYVTDYRLLGLFTRYDIASTANQTIRFEDDDIDRIWYPYHFSPNFYRELSTKNVISPGSYQLPNAIMMTATTPINESFPIGLYWETEDSNAKFYVYMHFSEVEELQANQTREFNISVNGIHWFGPMIPETPIVSTVFSTVPISGYKNITFIIYKTERSTLLPILNAVEIYVVIDEEQSETNEGNVVAVTNLKSMYEMTRNWQGDPCLPKAYRWSGLQCNDNGRNPPEIISLNLSSSGLKGEIASSLSDLTLLEILDLSNNSLTGSVPDFLSQLRFLKVLNLKGNKLTGPLPSGLIERSNNGLSLSVDDNLCSSASCENKKEKKSFVVPIVASIAASLVLLIAVTMLWTLRRRKQASKKDSGSKNREVAELKSREFTYSDIVRITNDFESELGRGGFGTVSHGYLDDGTEVAVKMLCSSSAQGYKEFHAEVELLMRVHHINLTTLVGFCNEGTYLGLVYEYMANGNLATHLSDRSPHIFTWEERLRIAVDAAQGLEYLHHGCKPPIIHRDIKSTNILLNEKFQAKLADFGLSRVFPLEGGTHVSTNVAGTLGYLDPDCLKSSRINEKNDVYSFGVVLLEIITNRPVIDNNIDPNMNHISQWVRNKLATGDIKNIIEPRLQGDFDTSSAWKAVETALDCVIPIPTKRPTMSDVVIALKECLAAEVARVGEGNGTPSNDSPDMNNENLENDSIPLAR